MAKSERPRGAGAGKALEGEVSSAFSISWLPAVLGRRARRNHGCQSLKASSDKAPPEERDLKSQSVTFESISWYWQTMEDAAVFC